VSPQPGARIGAFEILSLIGSGGMGEVYRARDTKLNRDVAIKTLPADVATDADRLARFHLEAQVLASLNHPNIAHIYGVEDSENVHALVMELVDGPTLADRIAQGPIPLRDALPIATQIARALEAAHTQGIIHRDLKPANIKVRGDGTVKVLDFGLAKAMGSGLSQATKGSSQLPTVASPAVTRPGMLLGTTAYMAPEQARGRVAGKSADVWAFGCVLYEMLTARSAFAGETVSDTIAKTLGRDPDWKALPASTPAKIREVLHQCLQKAEPQRFQDIKDVRIELDRIGTTRSGWRRSAELSLIAVGAVLAIAVGARWLGQKSASSSSPPAPVTILIADLENGTNDTSFDRALEPVLRISLENATFISAYDRTRINGTLGVRPPDKLDERAAMEIAVKQGVNTVLSGSIDRQGDAYVLTATATQTVTGRRVASATARAGGKDQMIQAAASLATTIRNALGDSTSDSTRMFAATTLSTTSLEVVRYYALAQEASASGRFEEALKLGSKTVELDPQFGVGYQIQAVASQNLDRHEDAVRYINEALRHLDGMTERERLTTRGMFFRLTGDYQQCEKEYRSLSARYVTDVIGYNQRALCLVQLGRMSDAVADISRAVKLLPKQTIFRVNLSLYASFAGEFEMAEREARSVIGQRVNAGLGLYVLGVALEAQGRLVDAAATYRELAKVDARWASVAQTGFAELAMYEGRFAEARKILAQGAATDVTAGYPDRAAQKLGALAALESQLGQRRSAVQAARQALAHSKGRGIRLAAAMALVDADAAEQARELAASLSAETPSDSRAYGEIVEAYALKENPRHAVNLLNEANNLVDTWLGHFVLGRAYLQDGQFAQADSEFDQCLKRRGETLAPDDLLLFGYLPDVHYYQGRAREGLKTERFADSYRRYLDIRGKAGEDRLLPDARRRLGN
jgi:serine/threonine protein kinase/tetratricopeptide (TPR) repeat protein